MTIYRIRHSGDSIPNQHYGYINTDAAPNTLKRQWLDFEESPASAQYMVHNTFTFVKWLNAHGVKAESIEAEKITDVYL